MHIVNRLMRGCWFDLVGIVPRPHLPEMAVGSTGIDDSQLLEEHGCMDRQVADGLLAYRLLDRLQDVIHLIDRMTGTDEQVGMIGHDDPTPEIEVVQFPGTLDGFDQPETGAIFVEKGDTTVGGKVR